MQEMQEMWVLSLEEEMATQSGILAWKIPRTEDPIRLWSMGLQRGGQDWMCTHTHTHISNSSSRKEKKIRGILRDEICRVPQSSWKNLVLSQILKEWRPLRREAEKHIGECKSQETKFSLQAMPGHWLEQGTGVYSVRQNWRTEQDRLVQTVLCDTEVMTFNVISITEPLIVFREVVHENGIWGESYSCNSMSWYFTVSGKTAQVYSRT